MRVWLDCPICAILGTTLPAARVHDLVENTSLTLDGVWPSHGRLAVGLACSGASTCGIHLHLELPGGTSPAVHTFELQINPDVVDLAGPSRTAEQRWHDALLHQTLRRKVPARVLECIGIVPAGGWVEVMVLDAVQMAAPPSYGQPELPGKDNRALFPLGEPQRTQAVSAMWTCSSLEHIGGRGAAGSRRWRRCVDDVLELSARLRIGLLESLPAADAAAPLVATFDPARVHTCWRGEQIGI